MLRGELADAQEEYMAQVLGIETYVYDGKASEMITGTERDSTPRTSR